MSGITCKYHAYAIISLFRNDQLRDYLLNKNVFQCQDFFVGPYKFQVGSEILCDVNQT